MLDLFLYYAHWCAGRYLLGEHNLLVEVSQNFQNAVGFVCNELTDSLEALLDSILQCAALVCLFLYAGEVVYILVVRHAAKTSTGLFLLIEVDVQLTANLLETCRELPNGVDDLNLQ